MRTALSLTALLVLGSGAVKAVSVACPPDALSAQSLSNINSYVVTSNNPEGGCFVTDKEFFGFTASGGSNAGTSTDPGLDDIVIEGSTNGTPSGTTLTGVSVTFGTPGTNQWQTTSNDTSNFNYVGAVVQSNAPVPTPPNTAWALDAFNLSIGGLNFSTAGQLAIVTEYVCLGGGSVPASGTTTALTCGASNLASITVLAVYNGTSTSLFDSCNLGGASVACAGTIANPSLANLSSLFPFSYSVQTVVQLVTAGATSLSLGHITEGFDEAQVVPEPATFGLIGCGLAGLMAFRSRSRKR